MKTQLIVGGVVLALIVALVLIYGNARYNQGVSDTLAGLRKDTIRTPEYKDSGFVAGVQNPDVFKASEQSGKLNKERSKRMRETVASVPPQVKTADTLVLVSALKLEGLYNLVDTLTDKYLDAIQPDSMRVDKDRYELIVNRDLQRPYSQRWAYWLTLKPIEVTDTSSTVTRTVVTTRFPWEAWAISGIAVILCILNIIYG